MAIKIKTLLFSLMANLPLLSQAVPLAATEVNPIEIGSTAPTITLQNRDAQKVQLTQLLADQAAVLIFYRGDWCPYCTRHLAELAEIEDEILAAGYQIIAISPDSPEQIAQTSAEGNFSYQLYSDSSMQAAQAFGLAFQVDAPTLEKYEKHGIDLIAASGHEHQLLPVPAVYVVDQNGLIKFRYFDPNYKNRLSGQQLLEAIRK
jgi:peroxiredoxin